MTSRQWILVVAAVGVGIVAQIPMPHSMATSGSGEHDMARHDSAATVAANGRPAAMADMPNGLAQVTFTITGMT